MSCALCCNSYKPSYFNPPEVDELMRYPKFDTMPQEDVMAFYMRYRNITKGQPFLNRKQFIEMLNSFSLFPNRKVANRMFDVVDKDQSSQIDFIEFMKYIFLLLDGSKEEKANFIFKMIAFKDKKDFGLNDLIGFYTLVTYDDKMLSSTLSDMNESDREQADDMGKVVFDILEIDYKATVSSQRFTNFILKEELAVDLFNFLNGDLESTTKGIKTKQSYFKMIKLLEHLQQDIYNLEDMFTGCNESYLDQKPKMRKQTKFTLTLQNIMRDKLINNNTMTHSPSFRLLAANTFQNRNPFKDSTIKHSVLNRRARESDDLLKKPTLSESQYQFNVPELVPNANHPMEANRVEALKVLNSMDDVTNKLITMLEKEIEIVEKEEKFSFNIKQDFNQESVETDNKKRVFLNNPNWNIVTTMITGIHKSLNIVSLDKYHALSKHDFKFHNKIEIEAVYSNQFDKCKFKDYAPYVFQSIRRQYGVSYDSYIKSIGVNTFRNAFFDKLYLMLSEHSSGKSGSFFFHTSDNKYMIKTIKKNEFDVLRDTLSQYHDHILKNPNTLLARYFGLHQIKCYSNNSLIYDIYIVVMNNVFNLQHPELMEHKYDLKGSTFKRYTTPLKVKSGAAKKDLNFLNDHMNINISYTLREKILNQIKSDSNFLARHNIIDYSLLVGIIKKSNDVKDRRPHEMQGSCEEDAFQKTETHKVLSDIESFDGQWNYYIGIIDTLTLYGAKKKGEYVAKRVFQGKGISCIPPKEYKDRFVNFMHNAMETN